MTVAVVVLLFRLVTCNILPGPYEDDPILNCIVIKVCDTPIIVCEIPSIVTAGA